MNIFTLLPCMIDRIDPLLYMEVMRKCKEYKFEDDNMIHTDTFDDIANLELSENIVISTPSKACNIVREKDGSLNVKVPNDLELSGSRVLVNGVLIQAVRIHMKFAIPKGIKLVYNTPFDGSYINNFYIESNVEKRASDDEGVPEYLTYQNFDITLHIDLNQLKKVNKTAYIKKGSNILNIAFVPIYYVGAMTFPNIQNTYIIKNDEIFKTFDEVF